MESAARTEVANVPNKIAINKLYISTFGVVFSNSAYGSLLLSVRYKTGHSIAAPKTNAENAASWIEKIALLSMDAQKIIDRVGW